MEAEIARIIENFDARKYSNEEKNWFEQQTDILAKLPTTIANNGKQVCQNILDPNTNFLDLLQDKGFHSNPPSNYILQASENTLIWLMEQAETAVLPQTVSVAVSYDIVHQDVLKICTAEIIPDILFRPEQQPQWTLATQGIHKMMEQYVDKFTNDANGHPMGRYLTAQLKKVFLVHISKFLENEIQYTIQNTRQAWTEFTQKAKIHDHIGQKAFNAWLFSTAESPDHPITNRYEKLSDVFAFSTTEVKEAIAAYNKFDSQPLKFREQYDKIKINPDFFVDLIWLANEHIRLLQGFVPDYQECINDFDVKVSKLYESMQEYFKTLENLSRISEKMCLVAIAIVQMRVACKGNVILHAVPHPQFNDKTENMVDVFNNLTQTYHKKLSFLEKIAKRLTVWWANVEALLVLKHLTQKFGASKLQLLKHEKTLLSLMATRNSMLQTAISGNVSFEHKKTTFLASTIKTMSELLAPTPEPCKPCPPTPPCPQEKKEPCPPLPPPCPPPLPAASPCKPCPPQEHTGYVRSENLIAGIMGMGAIS